MARKHSVEFKRQVVAEAAAGNIPALAKRHKISNSMVYQWRRQVEAGQLGERKVNQSKVSPQVRAGAVAELQGGGNAKEIAKKLGVSDASIYIWRKQAMKAKVNGHEPVPGDQFAELRDAANTAKNMLREAELDVQRRVEERGLKAQTRADHLLQLALKVLQGE